nr:hypothetical protein [Curtobacterium sp. Csp1]
MQLDPDDAAGDVVLDGVVEQVAQQLLDEDGFSDHPVGRGPLDRQGDSRHRSSGADTAHRSRDARSEVDQDRAALQTAFGLGEDQERLDQVLGPPVLLEHLRPRSDHVGWCGVVRQSDLERRTLDGQRRPQLVRRVRHEPALGLERGLEPVEQRVDGAGEAAEFVVRTVERDPFVERRRRDPVRGGGDPVDRREHPSTDEPADPTRQAAGHHDRRRGPLPLLLGDDRDQRHLAVRVGHVGTLRTTIVRQELSPSAPRRFRGHHPLDGCEGPLGRQVDERE